MISIPVWLAFLVGILFIVLLGLAWFWEEQADQRQRRLDKLERKDEIRFD